MVVSMHLLCLFTVSLLFQLHHIWGRSLETEDDLFDSNQKLNQLISTINEMKDILKVLNINNLQETSDELPQQDIYENKVTKTLYPSRLLERLVEIMEPKDYQKGKLNQLLNDLQELYRSAWTKISPEQDSSVVEKRKKAKYCVNGPGGNNCGR